MRRKLSPEKRHKIEERRRVVAEHLKAGLTYREIEIELLGDERFIDVGVSLGTVHSDIQAILARFHKDQSELALHYVQLEQMRLDAALQAIWQMVLEGNLGAVDRFLRISERRAKLLGLDAEYQVWRDLETMSDEELEFIIKGKNRRRRS